MSDSPLIIKSKAFALEIIKLCNETKKEKHESVLTNQLIRSGTSTGANIREAFFAHSKPDFIAKLQIALKEANETGYWLELLQKTDYLSQQEYQALEDMCRSLRVMLISSINTAKKNQK